MPGVEQAGVKIFRTKPKDLAFQLVDGIVYNANVLTNGVNHGGYSRTLWVDDSLVSICLTIDSVLIRDSYIWDMTGNLIVEPRQSVLAQFTDKELTEFARTGLLIKMK